MLSEYAFRDSKHFVVCSYCLSPSIEHYESIDVIIVFILLTLSEYRANIAKMTLSVDSEHYGVLVI